MGANNKHQQNTKDTMPNVKNAFSFSSMKDKIEFKNTKPKSDYVQTPSKKRNIAQFKNQINLLDDNQSEDNACMNSTPGRMYGPQRDNKKRKLNEGSVIEEASDES